MYTYTYTPIYTYIYIYIHTYITKRLLQIAGMPLGEGGGEPAGKLPARDPGAALSCDVVVLVSCVSFV